MKKLMYILIMCLFTTTVMAQQAPNFTETDINGVEHTLYDYLGEGKAVILDFSATWCGPCWGNHVSGVLEDLYHDLGPDGEDLVRVLFIESDTSTHMDDLLGTTAETMGDWITGTPYPIIDLTSTSLTDAYSIDEYPTLILISPQDSSMTTYDPEPPNLLNMFYDVIEVAELIEAEADLKAVSAGTLPVSECDRAVGIANFVNIGNLDIQDPSFDFFVDGVYINTVNYSGTIMPKDSVNITMPDDMLLMSGENTITVVSNDNDANNTNNTVDKIVEYITSDNVLTISIETDGFCDINETSVEIYNENNDLVFSSGILPNSTAWSEEITLADLGCHTIRLTQLYWGLGEEAVVVSNASGDTLYIGDIVEIDYATRDLLIGISNASTIEEILEIDHITISPNPVNLDFNLNMRVNEATDLNYIILDQLGRTVSTGTKQNILAGENNINIDTENLKPGLYMLSIETNTQSQCVRFVKY